MKQVWLKLFLMDMDTLLLVINEVDSREELEVTDTDTEAWRGDGDWPPST